MFSIFSILKKLFLNSFLLLKTFLFFFLSQNLICFLKIYIKQLSFLILRQQTSDTRLTLKKDRWANTKFLPHKIQINIQPFCYLLLRVKIFLLRLNYGKSHTTAENKWDATLAEFIQPHVVKYFSNGFGNFFQFCTIYGPFYSLK